MKFVKINRDFWVYLIFVVVAILFWFAQAMQEQTSITTDYEVRLVNVPNNVIFTSDIPKTVSVSLSGRGYSLFHNLWNNRHDTIDIDYGALAHLNGRTVIDMTTWKKIFSDDIQDHISVNSVNPSPFEIYTSTGEHRQVKVRFNGKVVPDKDFTLCGVNITPQVVDAYAPALVLDTVTVAHTEIKHFNHLNDTTTITLALQPLHGVKFVPNKVKVQLCVDLMTNKTLSVPINAINVPSGHTLRTFPDRVDITFGVSATLYNTITSSDFNIIVDYNQAGTNINTLPLHVNKKPDGVNNIKLSTKLVEYIVE